MTLLSISNVYKIGGRKLNSFSVIAATEIRQYLSSA